MKKIGEFHKGNSKLEACLGRVEDQLIALGVNLQVADDEIKAKKHIQDAMSTKAMKITQMLEHKTRLLQQKERLVAKLATSQLPLPPKQYQEHKRDIAALRKCVDSIAQYDRGLAKLYAPPPTQPVAVNPRYTVIASGPHSQVIAEPYVPQDFSHPKQ